MAQVSYIVVAGLAVAAAIGRVALRRLDSDGVCGGDELLGDLGLLLDLVDHGRQPAHAGVVVLVDV
jgi:hypothetical protein